MSEFKYINKVSCELEGGWNIPRGDLTKDPSLEAQHFVTSVNFGELIPKEPFADKETMFKFMVDNWPTERSHKCSLHIHFSFKNILHYSQSMSKEFYRDYFLPAMEQWGRDYPCTNKLFWERLAGNIKYCKREHAPEKQLFHPEKGEHRYTHLQFCWTAHKTWECRLFPMFDSVKTAQSATRALIECVENYLDSKPAKDAEESCEFQLDENFHLPGMETKRKEKIIRPFNLFRYKKLQRGEEVTEDDIDKEVMAERKKHLLQQPEPDLIRGSYYVPKYIPPKNKIGDRDVDIGKIQTFRVDDIITNDPIF